MVTKEKIRKCRICTGTEFREVIDMGFQPLVNSLINKADIKKDERVFSLIVERCNTCSLVQIVKPVDSHKIYQEQDYLYFTGDMPTTDAYFKEFAAELAQFHAPVDLIVEIGSNDGTLLKHFNGRILGVDPSTNVVVRALARQIPTIAAGFDERLAKTIREEFGGARIIGGANCIAHINDLHSLMEGVKYLLRYDGVFWVECNYWGGMVKNLNYSLVYHDHYSYFTLKNWKDIAAKYDMKVFDAYVTPAQGGSLRVFLSKDKRTETKRFRDIEREEKETNLNSYETTQIFYEGVSAKAEILGKRLKELHAEGKVIAGYGAAAKGFSILSLAGIRHEVKFFVDDSPAKQGKYTPINHIPVVKREDKPDPDVFIITAPNYADVIKEKEKDFKGEWITP